jgi:predicted RNase H-like HicB family nuclease
LRGTGASRADAEANMYDAIQMHIEGLREDGIPIPESTAFAEYMLVGAESR